MAASGVKKSQLEADMANLWTDSFVITLDAGFVSLAVVDVQLTGTSGDGDGQVGAGGRAAVRPSFGR